MREGRGCGWVSVGSKRSGLREVRVEAKEEVEEEEVEEEEEGMGWTGEGVKTVSCTFASS